MISFRKLSEKEFKELLTHSVETYAAELCKYKEFVRLEDAMKQAEKEVYPLVPEGLKTPDQYCYMIVDGKKNVGYYWYQTLENRTSAFICYIYIFEEFRRHGYARQTLNLYEAEIRSMGVKVTSLCVFKENTPATNLYTQLGYAIEDELILNEATEVSRLVMAKRFV